MHLIEITKDNRPPLEQLVYLVAPDGNKRLGSLHSVTETKDGFSFSFYEQNGYDEIWFTPTHYAILPEDPPEK